MVCTLPNVCPGAKRSQCPSSKVSILLLHLLQGLEVISSQDLLRQDVYRLENIKRIFHCVKLVLFLVQFLF